jgi:hypothetical protein
MKSPEASSGLFRALQNGIHRSGMPASKNPAKLNGGGFLEGPNACSKRS